MINSSHIVFYFYFFKTNIDANIASHCNNNGADVVLFLCHYSFLTPGGSIELLAQC